MAYTTINKSGDYFNTSLWSGNGSAQTISGVGFQPDWLWTKCRSDSYSNILIDSVRGITKQLKSEGNAAEATNAQGVTAFNADGYVLGTQADFAVNGNTFVGWGWKANGAGSANTDGAVSTTVSVNTTAGFSIVKYTGTGTTTNFGHGLGVKPNVILIKSLSTNDWVMNGDFLGSTTWQHKIILNTTAAKATANNFNDQAPTNSVFYLNSAHGTTNGSGTEYIAYCFAEKTGYSKFGSYVGNGNADGTFVYTGFKPAFIMYKKSSGTGRWTMEDNKRDPFNVATHGLAANGSSAENTGSNYWDVDLLSNGFKFRTTEQETNQSGQTFIYMAFGAAPLVGSNNVPCTAR